MVYFFLAVIFLCAGLSRLRFIGSNRLWPDEALYRWIGQRIFDGPLFIFSPQAWEYHPPLFSSFLALDRFFFPDGSIADQGVSYMFNMVGILLLYLLGRKINNPFTGILSAILLAGNGGYFQHSNLVLPDIPLTAGYMLLFLLLMTYGSKNYWITDIFILSVFVCLILIKSSSVIVFFILCVFYGFLYKKRIALFLAALIGLVFGFLFLRRLKYVFEGDSCFIQPFDYYFINFIGLLHIPLFSIPFLILGCYVLLRKRSKVSLLMLIWFLTPIFFSSFAAEKDPRYLLPVLPPLILTIAIGIDYVLIIFSIMWMKTCAQLFILIIFLFGFLNAQTMNERFIEHLNRGYTGFQEAGQWLKENSDRDAVIYAGSRRAVRYCSGIEFKEYGGRMYALPKNLEDLTKILLQNKGRKIFIIIDRWEYLQPRWAYPLSNQKLRTISALGLHLQAVVEDIRSKIPLVLIYSL